MNTSVCLATYNGERYLVEQIDSILNQLDKDDELIVVDDCSKDNTIAILNNYNDDRIKVYKNERNLGHVKSFGRAISLATKEFIVMADQDDIWIENRLHTMISSMKNNNAMLVSSNSEYIDESGSRIKDYVEGLSRQDSSNIKKNLYRIFKGKADYFGCAMAFHRKLNNIVLPIPSHVESHDIWIALCGILQKSNLHIEEKTLKRRVHGTNASILQRKLLPKIWSRIIFLISIATIYYRKIARKKWST